MSAPSLPRKAAVATRVVPLPSPRTKRWQWTKTPRARTWFTLCRWVHVYLSTALFSLLLFFCITGFLLNHSAWFADDGKQGVKTFSLPTELVTALAQTQTPPVGLVERFIEQKTGLTKPRKFDIDRELGEWTFDYPLPGGYAFITLSSHDSSMAVEYHEGNAISIMNDLHKGRHSGPIWSWVIDGSALLIVLLALTGLFILFQQAKWRVSGLVLVIAGTVTPWLIYLFWVPAFHP